MFVVPALLLAMSVSSQAETSLVMTRVDGGMQELGNLCLESEHFDICKCFFYDGWRYVILYGSVGIVGTAFAEAVLDNGITSARK
jgi:hypothetical protein